jgi:hypothetical protein
VEVFHAPSQGGGWEEIWRSLEMIEFFDVDAVLRHTRLLGSALTAARVGFYLEQHRDPLLLEDKHLKPFERLAPAQPRYFDSRRQSGKLLHRWNLIVPDFLLKRQWEETVG